MKNSKYIVAYAYGTEEEACKNISEMKTNNEIESFIIFHTKSNRPILIKTKKEIKHKGIEPIGEIQKKDIKKFIKIMTENDTIAEIVKTMFE